MTDKDDNALNAMIELSDIPLKPPHKEFWFSYSNQKYYRFVIAKELLVMSEDMKPDECIELANEFVDAFYNQVIRQD